MKIQFKYLAPIIFLLIPLVTVQVSCKKDVPSNPLIFMSPEDLHIYADVGDVVSFNISATSESGLASFKIESKVDNGTSFTQTDFEETLSSVGSYSKLYEMIAPQAASGESLILTFTATDVDGLQTVTLRRLWVQASETLLSETSGHIMYNGNSPNADAYDLDLGLPVISLWSTDSTERDIQDYPVDSLSTILSRTWVSPAGGSFVRFNSFDYANATDSSLAQAFTSGLALPQVDNLMEFDILLYRFEDSTRYAAIQITEIVNTDTTTTGDLYRFSIKK